MNISCGQFSIMQTDDVAPPTISAILVVNRPHTTMSVSIQNNDIVAESGDLKVAGSKNGAAAAAAAPGSVSTTLTLSNISLSAADAATRVMDVYLTQPVTRYEKLNKIGVGTYGTVCQIGICTSNTSPYIAMNSTIEVLGASE